MLSSAGRASPLQGEGHRFDPYSNHHFFYLIYFPPDLIISFAKYEVAKTEEEKNELRNVWNAAKDKLSVLGEHTWKIYREYAIARKNGNDILDFNDIAWEKDIPEIVRLLRENGITEFTMSSTWSSTVKVCMAFVECGCTLTGMTKIKGDKTCSLTKKNEHEILPAYVFKVN